MYNVERVPVKHFKILKKYIKSMPDGPMKEKIKQAALDLIEDNKKIAFDEIEKKLIDDTMGDEKEKIRERLVQAKLTPDAAHKAMLSGCRLTGPEAVEWGIASAAVPEDQVLTVAAERAAPLAGKGRETVATIKKVMYASAIETLALQESF